MTAPLPEPSYRIVVEAPNEAINEFMYASTSAIGEVEVIAPMGESITW
jgi:hypothetical protein